MITGIETGQTVAFAKRSVVEKRLICSEFLKRATGSSWRIEFHLKLDFPNLPALGFNKLNVNQVM